MAVLWFDGLLLQAQDAGVYFLPGDDVDELREAAAVNGFRCLPVDLGDLADGDMLTDRLAQALHLPGHVHGDTEAFADALAELRGHDARGLVLLLENSEGLRRGAIPAFKAVMETLQAASGRWATRGTPLWTFIAMDEAEFESLDEKAG